MRFCLLTIAFCFLSGAFVGPSQAVTAPQLKAEGDVIVEIGGAPGLFQISVQCPASASNATAINFSSQTKVLIIRTYKNSLAITDTTSQGKPAPPTVELEPETNCKIVAQGSQSEAIIVHPAPYVSTLEWTTNTGSGNNLEIAPQISSQDVFHFSVMEPREISAVTQNLYLTHVGPTNVGGVVLIVSRSLGQKIPSAFTCYHNKLQWPCPRR